MSTDRSVRRAIQIALMAGVTSAFAFSPSVFAQEQDQGAEEEDLALEEVIVTGSRIRGSTDDTSVTPVSVFGSEDLAASGVPTLEGFLQAQPFVTGGFQSSRVNNGNPGQAQVSLRGLGAGRTLVLVDGFRVPPSTTGNSVDINQIPMSSVERIEVLRDGASTIYGSDAIAGVVNIITKQDFDGMDFRAGYDVTDESDGEIYTASITTGATSDRGRVVMGVEYTDRREIWQGDRSFSRCPLQEFGGELICSGSGTSYPGHIFPTESDGDWILDGETLRPFEPSDGYNYAEVSYMVTPSKMYNFYANSSYDLIMDGFSSMTAFTSVMFSNRKSQQQMAAVGTFWAPLVGADHPGNPFDEDVYVARRLAENDTGRFFTQDVNTYRMIAGLEGNFRNGWTWDVSYNYARGVDTRVIEGQINQPRVNVALSPTACAADPNCPKVWDPFRVDTLDDEIKNYILVTHSPVGRRTLRQAQANLVGDFGSFELPAGPLNWAVGIEQRKEDAEFIPDGAASLGMIYFVSGEKTEGKIAVDEAYGEIDIPILADLPFADLLSVNLSARYSDYGGSIGSNTNAKGSIEWAPIPSLRFRATYAEGFRAPSIGELYAPQTKSAQQYNDPCLNYGAGASANVTANCQADGLPPDFGLTSTQGTALFGGNPDLTPEESESTSFGIVWTPDFTPLSIRLDYFDIEITDGIGTAGTNNVITSCYESSNFSHPLCELLEGPSAVGEAPHPTSPRRNAIGNIAGIILTNANLSTFNTSGVDFNVDWFTNLGNGQLNLSVAGTWLDENSYVLVPGAETVDQVGFFAEDQWNGSPAGFPEWQARFNIGYAGDSWGINYIPRYIDNVRDIFASETNLSNETGNYWYHDIQGYYNWNAWDFTVGIRNATDEDPPYVTNNDDMNTIMMTYDTAGRYYYFRFGFRY